MKEHGRETSYRRWARKRMEGLDKKGQAIIAGFRGRNQLASQYMLLKGRRAMVLTVDEGRTDKTS